MRRSNKINKTEVEKEVARRKYGERQIDKWVKWSFTMRGKVLWKELMEQIKTKIKTGASPRHVPAKIIEVHDIPRTKSGKIAELAVRDLIHNKPINNITALANPECLEEYKNIKELSV